MSTASFHNEKELLQQLAAGNEAALKELFDAWRPKLYAYVYKILKSHELAEEVVMDVFLKLWMGRDLAQKIDHFERFLFRVAYNLAIDVWRAAAKDPVLSKTIWEQIETSSAQTPEIILDNKEYEFRLREAISLLSPKKQRIYRLSREENFTHEEIAQKLNLSKSTVNNQIVAAQRFIRDYLSSHLDIAILIIFLSRK